VSDTGVVSVYQQPTQYFLYPSHRTRDGIWRAAGPTLAFPLDAPDTKLGETVLYLLTECRLEVAPPATPDRPRHEVLALLKPARIQSWMALQRKAKLVSVKTTANELRVEPTRNGGNRGPDAGFHFLLDQAERFDRHPSPELLGAAVRRAFITSTRPPAA